MRKTQALANKTATIMRINNPTSLLNINLGFTNVAKLLYDGLFEDIKA
ncbi:hypothetical protein QL919_04625 [Psychrobacter sp. APC 3426]|nr:hypothetical protein [Psychrobacter sp. APC 3426]MDN3398007.1 hypothetical protein [Psychrobacter sp. APC 3426]